MEPRVLADRYRQLVLMKKTIFTIITLTLCFSQIKAQETLCFDNATGDWWPIEPGLEFKYSVGRDSKTSLILNDSVKLNGKFYLIEKETYKSGKTTETYWRIENGAVYTYNQEKEQESKELPASPQTGQQWTSTDGIWNYEVVSLNSSFSTPYCEFEELLEIKTSSSERKGTIYNLFYKRGIGLVGLSVNGNPYTIILPNKKMNDKDFMAFGCEHLSTADEIRNCTYQKIFEFIKTNYKAPKKVKKGRILVSAIIGKDGYIESATIKEGIRNADEQEKEAIRVTKALPQLIPAQVDDNAPVRTAITIPFNF